MTGLVRQWDIHRHRMAPPVADAMAAHIADGRIAVLAAPGFSAWLRGDTVVLDTAAGELVADRLVVCTGPQSDVTLSQLGRSLVGAGRARQGPYRIGYDVDPVSGALIDASGHADDRIIAMGPLRRGVLFESTAIPEISVQARDLAARILLVSSSA